MTTNPAQPIHPPAGIQVGDKLDKFEIVEQIGAGGMSVVWKGYDPLLDRAVAIKQLIPGPGDLDTLRERFRLEAQTHKRVAPNERHIVRIIDFLDEPRGLFIIMELVDGSSLEQVLATTPGPLEERRALGVVAATAVALEAIHERGVLHRDLKPSNILLPRKGGLKVSDFGLAALVGEQDVLTLGTVRYMAPELFSETPADARADIYSLGMIAYEMLAGRERFDDAFKIILRDQRNQGTRWMKWHTNARVKAPPLTQLNPAVSPTLADLVARMMEKDPSRRIASASELLAAIRRHFVADPDAAGPAETLTLDTAGGAVVRVPGVARSLAIPQNGPTGVAPASASTSGISMIPGAAGKPTVIPVPNLAAAPSQNPTAPLPRKSRLSLILACVLAVELIGGAVGYTVWTNRNQQAKTDQRKAALAEMKAADEDYRANRMDMARDRYMDLAKAWPNDRAIGLRSKALSLMSQAQIDIDAASYDAAITSLKEADATGAFRDNRDQIQDLINRATKAASAAKVMQEIRDLTAKGEFAQVNKKILGLRNAGLAPEQDAELKQLAVVVADQASQERTNREVELSLAEARKLVLEDKRDKAIASLEEAYRRLRAAPLRQAADLLTKKIKVEGLDAQGKEAEQSGDLKAAIEAFSNVNSLQPSKEVAEHIKDLRSRAALEEGQRLLEANDPVGAAAAFERSIQARDNPEAQAALAKISATKKKDVLTRAGDDAAGAGDFDAALKHYQDALGMGADDAVARKVTMVKIRRELRLGQQALEQEKADEAIAAVKNARSFVRGQDTRAAIESQGIGKALDELERRAQYRQRLAAGDALRGRSKFAEAKAEYRKARELYPTKEVSERMDDAEYALLLAQTRVAIENEQWGAARGLALAAAKLRGSDEVKQLLTMIDNHGAPGAN
ncbi:MAG: protein kinase [Planctomycetota bacterium]|nr:protein kinase [Planctomycetota bacterium]